MKFGSWQSKKGIANPEKNLRVLYFLWYNTADCTTADCTTALLPAVRGCIFIESCRYTCKFTTMKHALLLFLIIPFVLSARVDPRVPPQKAPYTGVKSVECTYIFVIKQGNDTSIAETFQYNESGFLTSYFYDQHMMKNPHYSMKTTYRYQSQNAWTQATYSNGKISDSAVVNGSWANHYWYYNGRVTQLNEFRGDTFAEKNTVNGDTVLKHRDVTPSATKDEFWDYNHAGTFARKSFVKSASTDTTCYLDAEGNCLVMVVNFYDGNLNCVKTDYYNYRVKRFDLLYLRYSEGQSMIFFLNKSKKGHWSYEITRKYNEKGWLIEEYSTDANPNRGGNGTPMLKLYKYTLY